MSNQKTNTLSNADSSPELSAPAGSALLFPLAEIASKSPRLRWMESHGIKTMHRDDLPTEAGRWEAYVGDYETAVTRTLTDSEARFYPDESPFLAWGETEEDAILALAENNGWPLWQNAVVSHAAPEPRPLDPSQPVGTIRPR